MMYVFELQGLREGCGWGLGVGGWGGGGEQGISLRSQFQTSNFEYCLLIVALPTSPKILPKNRAGSGSAQDPTELCILIWPILED